MPVFMTQIVREKEKGLDLSSWENIEAETAENAAHKTLKKHFPEVRALSFIWVYVATSESPKHSNGMPMIVSSFKLGW